MSEIFVANDGIENIDGDDDNFLPSFTGREGTIYLIDASIFGDVDQFQLCLDCIEADLLKSIIISPKDLVSVVFYNTQKSPLPNAQFDVDGATTNVPANCAVCIPLKPLSKQLIQYFKNFRESDDFFGFATTHGVSNESCFSEALWLCSRLIIRSNYKLFFSKIVLFTNNEQPHMLNTPEEQQAHFRAKDLYNNNISVDVVPMVDQFDFEPFYKEFLCAVENMDTDDFRSHDPVDKRFEMLNQINRSNYKKACLRHINLKLADDVLMSCDVYSFTRNAKKPNAVKMLRENKEVVTAKRSYYVDEQNPEDESDIVERKVLTSQLYKCQNICGKEILFSPDEVVKMKAILKPCLRLLGFKPVDQLQRLMVKKNLFLYPNEKTITGSTTLFRALWEKCLEKQKYALCTITMRAVTPPKYIALVPQKADEHGNDGFAMIFLAVATSIGALDTIINKLPEPTPDQVSLFEKLGKKLKFKYNFQSFSNPALNDFYAHLEAAVYDEDIKVIEDLSLPDLAHQDGKIESLLPLFEDEFGTEEAASSRGKRANGGTLDGGVRSKTSKKDLSMDEIQQAIRNGRMEAVTVQHLKDFIRSKNANHPPSAVKKNLFEIAQKLTD